MSELQIYPKGSTLPPLSREDLRTMLLRSADDISSEWPSYLDPVDRGYIVAEIIDILEANNVLRTEPDE